MSSRVKQNGSEVILLGSVMLIVVLGIAMFLIWRFSNDKDTWSNFWNVFGGTAGAFSGGVLAYLIAKQQSKNDREAVMASIWVQKELEGISPINSNMKEVLDSYLKIRFLLEAKVKTTDKVSIDEFSEMMKEIDSFILPIYSRIDEIVKTASLWRVNEIEALSLKKQHEILMQGYSEIRWSKDEQVISTKIKRELLFQLGVASGACLKLEEQVDEYTKKYINE